MGIPSITPLGALERTAGFVHEALTPAWMEATWSGVFGSKGLEAVVHDADSAMMLGRDWMLGMGAASGEVRSASGAVVGEFDRGMQLADDTGRLDLHHATLKLGDQVQGSGFGRAFNDHAFVRYAQAGVDAVTLHAGKTVGGYAWARQGFELDVRVFAPAEQAARRAIGVRELVAEATAKGAISAAERASLEPRLVQGTRVHDDTITSVAELAGMGELGKRILLGRNWAGVRELGAPPEIAAARAGLRDTVAARLPAGWDPAQSLPKLEAIPLRGATRLEALPGLSSTSIEHGLDGSHRALTGHLELAGRTADGTRFGAAKIDLVARPKGVFVPKITVDPDLRAAGLTKRAVERQLDSLPWV